MMSKLENKIPPAILWVLASALTYLVDQLDLDGSPLESASSEIWGMLLALAGIVVAFLGLRQFSAARTSIDPHAIEKASTLVTGGVYRLTRNPMYLGMVLLSLGWALRLGTVIGMVIGTGFLIAALTKLQIEPEERMLVDKFGASYEAYRADVRRWI